VGIRGRTGHRGPPGPLRLLIELEGQPRPTGVADVDALAVEDVDHRRAVAVQVSPVHRSVVDGLPPALVETQNQVSARDSWIDDANVGAQVAPDDDVVTGGEGALGPVMANCQRWQDWSTHSFSITAPALCPVSTRCVFAMFRCCAN
jgi:hypothetical protein